jgi:hypothetical protein
MITSIPTDQVCQAFDPMMFLPEKTYNIIGSDQFPNTSCVAPAFVYIEGMHGKKFLCDFHYYYELNMTRDSLYKIGSEAWKGIQNFIIDEREKIKDTFAKNISTSVTVGKKCELGYGTKYSCKSDGLVCIIKKDSNNGNDPFFYCNFHFRKNYYRYYSNGVIFEDVYNIVDERSRMTMTIAEEALNLNCV